jgi:two-component system, LytTR family, response regulator
MSPEAAAARIGTMRIAMPQHEDEGPRADDVVEFLVKHLDGGLLADVLRRLSQQLPAAAPARAAPSRVRIACAGARAIKLVPLREVEYVKSSLAGVYAVTPAGEFYTDLTLTALEADPTLLRCHKQYLVNVERIDEIDLSCPSIALIRTRSGFSVPVGRRYRGRLRTALRI